MTVSVSRVIAAPPPEVWGVISAPGYLAEVHPFCESNLVEQWPGVGARDSIAYYGGRVVQRDFTAWEEGSGYELDVSDANGGLAHVTWILQPEPGDESTLTITIEPRMLAKVPVYLRWAPGLMVGPMLRRYLRSVLRGIEWRVVQGTPVARNQFG